MAAKDLEGGDLEYAEWAEEAKLVVRLEGESTELEYVRYQLPRISPLNSTACPLLHS